MDIQKLAERANKYFQSKKKPSTEETFWTLKDKHPKWLYDMVFKIHDSGKWPPDDYKYEYIVDTLDRLEEGVDPEEGRDEIEADIYTSDLFTWISSRVDRQSYADEVLSEFEPKTLSDLLVMAQVREKEEIWTRVVEALQERLDDIEAGLEEDFGGPKEWSPGV